jgi:hypothetical protein
MLRADEIAQMFGETIAPLELFETLGRLDYQDRYDEFGCPRPAAEVQRRQAARLAQMEKEWQECPELAP